MCDCHPGAGYSLLQPPPDAPLYQPLMLRGPLPFQTVSLRRVPSALRSSFVPPTAITVLNEAGSCGTLLEVPVSQSNMPSSPVDARTTVFGWSKCVASGLSPATSGPPQEFETIDAPALTAVSFAIARLAMLA